MRYMAKGAGVIAAAAAGTIVARRFASGSGTGTTAAARDRWHSVTINRNPAEVGSPPEALAGFGETVEVRVRPAPGGRGTELAARIRKDLPTGVDRVVAKLADGDPVRQLRRALREAKQVAEVGEVLLPDSPPTTEPTLTSVPLRYASRHGRGEGRL